MLFLSYGYRSLIARMRTNAVTMLAVAVFVAAASLGLSFYLGLKRMLVETAPAENILVLSTTAPNEAGSVLSLETARRVAVLDGVKRVSGTPVAVRELVTAMYLGDAQDPTLIRGIDDESQAVHRVALLQGAAPARGSLEIMLGRRVAEQHPEIAIGSEIPLPGGPARVTGVLAAAGSPFEDEIWTPRSALELHLKRQITSTVTLVAEDASRVAGIVDAINGGKDLKARASTVAEYRASRADLGTIARIVLILLVMLSVVASFAIATTMNASTAARMPELATLVAIGIRRPVLGRIVLMESILLAVTGALVGVVVSAIARGWIGTAGLGAAPVDLSSASAIPIVGAGLGLAVGLIGGMYPAYRVKRLDVLQAVR